ncbi:Carbohydrate esterase family 4 protein [Mycena indigotica]|uniref:chitin deacetylase n=1 Tax=Mycena indigotica TaxID=2126181 RepID=A0A8H6WKU5_9AGAR|nr:Carbohydrate esterase family 4 protein [Mycena indigotica]KAF7316104.1 Carbohydrate esterase family 4 protein [Mycena indigotica]
MPSLAPLLLAFLASRVYADGTEQSEAALGPTQACAPYSYAPVTAAMTASKFPPIWQPVAGILSGDTAATSLFSSFSSSIPNIAPKGTLGVPDPNAQSKYPATDPDCWWTASTCTTPKASGVNPDVAAVPEPQTLGYGFDDGPNCSHNAFYDYLTQKNQKATLFYIGSNVMDWPLQAQRAVADNHEICVHSWSHRSMTAFTNEQAFAELYYTLQAIKLVTGYTPTCWRPPLGDVDDRIRFIAQKIGLYNVLWKYNSNDWEVSSGAATPAQVQANYDTLMNDAKSGKFSTSGAIILTHELNNYTMQTAIDNYPNLAAAFKYIVPVGVALNKTQPYVESNYTQKSFAQYTGTQPPTGGSSGSNSPGGSSGAAHPSSSGGPSSNSSSKTNTGQAAGSSVAVSVSPHFAALMSALFGLAGVLTSIL